MAGQGALVAAVVVFSREERADLGIVDCKHLIRPARRFAPVGFFVGSKWSVYREFTSS